MRPHPPPCSPFLSRNLYTTNNKQTNCRSYLVCVWCFSLPSNFFSFSPRLSKLVFSISSRIVFRVASIQCMGKVLWCLFCILPLNYDPVFPLPFWLSLRSGLRTVHRPPCSRNVSFLPLEEEEPASFYLRNLYATAMSLFTKRGRHVEDFFSHSQPIWWHQYPLLFWMWLRL